MSDCRVDVERRLASIERRLSMMERNRGARRGVVKLAPESIELPPDTTLEEDIDYLLAEAINDNEQPYPF